MRVLMVTWDYPPQAVNAIAAHVVGLANALDDAGHEVVVLTVADPKADVTAERTAAVRVRRADPELPWLPLTRPIARIASANLAIARVGVGLDRDLDGWRPDIVHAHDWRSGWAADVVATQHDVPLIVTMHGTERLRRGGHLPQGEPTDVNSIEWWLAFRADRLIASTKYTVEHIVSEFELPPEHVVRVPNGVDPARWARPPDTPIEREPHVVAWGRVQYEKGFQLLGPAMHQLRAKVPGVRCTIAGRGSYLPELQSQIDVEGASDVVDFAGYLAHDDLRALAHRAGCVVIPSLYEPFGIVALEALAAGAPLVVARTGGLAEVVDGTGAGIMFEPGNADELARAIELVLENPTLADELVAEAAELVRRRYSWHAIAESTVRVYETARVLRR